MLQQVDPVDFGFALFCIFFGAGYGFVRDENEEKISVAARLYSQFTAVLLVGILALLALAKLHMYVGWVAFFGLLLSIGAERFLSLVRKYYKEAQSLPDFIRRMRKAYDLIEKDDTPGVDSPNKDHE